MFRMACSLLIVASLAACGDPLRRVDRLSDLDVQDDSASVQVAADPQEAGQTGGLLARLRGTPSDVVEDETVDSSAEPVVDPAPEVDTAPAPRRGLAGLFRRNQPNQPDQSDAIDAAVTSALSLEAPTDPEVAQDPPSDQVLTQAPQRPRRGLGALFGRNRDAAQVTPVVAQDTDPAAAPVSEAPETATAIPPVAETPEAEARTRRLGLFGRRAPAPATGPDAALVEQGTFLPYGEIARVCGLSRRELGTRIESDIGYELFDTIPNTTAARTFYITGFDDNCARQFTGALVMTGDVGTHEIVRYASHNDGLAYSATDNAYEAIKAQFCRVPHGQPCGARLEALGEVTTFLTVYDRFGGGDSWVEILIHKGQVVAMGHKG